MLKGGAQGKSLSEDVGDCSLHRGARSRPPGRGATSLAAATRLIVMRNVALPGAQGAGALTIADVRAMWKSGLHHLSSRAVTPLAACDRSLGLPMPKNASKNNMVMGRAAFEWQFPSGVSRGPPLHASDLLGFRGFGAPCALGRAGPAQTRVGANVRDR